MDPDKPKPRNSSTQFLTKFLAKLKRSDRKIYTEKASFITILSESTASESIQYEDLETETIHEGGEESPKIDLRYGGQCLTVEQLPEFCSQLQRLVEVVRNVQNYGKVTGEYPRYQPAVCMIKCIASELERRLEEEAREVVALTAEVRNARDVVSRTRFQRRALKMQKKMLLADLKYIETRELEIIVRMSDRKLYRSWENIKDSSEPAAFAALLEEIKNKQTALACLTRLVEDKQASLNKQIELSLTPQTNESNCLRKNDLTKRAGHKRRRKDSRSVPLSIEPSTHAPYEHIESTSRQQGSAGAVSLPPIRDIIIFTTH